MLSKLFFFLLLTSSLRAEVASKGNCSVSWELFSSQKEFDTFFAELKASAAAKNKVKLSELALYPLNTIIKNKITLIKDKKEFVKKFDQFYSASITEAILKQDPKTAFCNSQGMMLGSGQVWVNKRGKKTGIITINHSEFK